MKAFNPERELKKIQHGNRNKIIFGIFLLLIILGISSSYALYQVRYSKRIIYTKVAPFSNHDIDLAVLVDGVPSSNGDFPEKDAGKIYDKIDCDNKNLKAYWDYDEWALVVRTNKKAKCTVYFKTPEKYIDQSGANPPELYDGLIPVKYEDKDNDNKPEIYVADTSKEWYDYDNHEWANAVLINNDDPNFISDFSGNGNYPTIVGSPSMTNEGLKLNGNYDGLFLGNKLQDLYKHSNTIQIKLKRNPNKTNVIISNYKSDNFVQYDVLNTNEHYIIWNHDSVLLRGGEFNYDSDTFVTITYVYNWEDGTITVYNDDVVSYTFQHAGYKKVNFNFLNAYIGRNDSQPEISLEGTIEKFIIYDSALTKDEITHNLTAQAGKTGGNGVIKDNLRLYYDFSISQNVDTSANAKLDIEAISQMYVWIPRYKYALFNATPGYTSNEQMINIKFENGTSSTGNVSCTIDLQGKETCTNALNGNWYTHPAFTFGKTELPGIWLGKFEISGTTDYITVKPNIKAIVNLNTSTMFDSVRNIDLKYAKNYKLDSAQIDTHLEKNMDWGAAVYLSQSQYGRCDKNGVCTEITYNGTARPATTGYAQSNYQWNTQNGKLASTTGNMYGIYDMSGGDWEYTISCLVDENGNMYYSNSGFNAENKPDEKYYNKYSSTPSSFLSGHFGDATRETMTSIGKLWQGDYSAWPVTTAPWIYRAGWIGDGASTCGPFATAYSVGSNASFRAVITAQDGNE